MKKLTENSINYLGNWTKDDLFDDYQLFYDLGAYELCAIRLANSGAVEENNNAEEKNINDVAKSISYTQEVKMIRRLLKDTLIKNCLSCNAYVFVDEQIQNISINDITSCPQCLAVNFSTPENFNKE